MGTCSAWACSQPTPTPLFVARTSRPCRTPARLRSLTSATLAAAVTAVTAVTAVKVGSCRAPCCRSWNPYFASPTAAGGALDSTVTATEESAGLLQIWAAWIGTLGSGP